MQLCRVLHGEQTVNVEMTTKLQHVVAILFSAEIARSTSQLEDSTMAAAYKHVNANTQEIEVTSRCLPQIP